MRLGVDPAEAVAAQPLAGERAQGVHGNAVEPDLALLRRRSCPDRQRSSVVLPLPRGPVTARISPSRTPSETPLQRGRAVVGVVQGACPEHVVVRRGHHGVHLGSDQIVGRSPVRGNEGRADRSLGTRRDSGPRVPDSTRPGCTPSHSNGWIRAVWHVRSAGCDRSAGWADRGSELRPRLRQHRAQDLLDLVEGRLVGDQRRRQLDDRVAAVVGTAVQAVLEQRLGEEAVEDALGLLVGEGLLGGLVLDQLDAVEEAVAADVADDRQVVQLLQRATGTRPRCRGRAG